MPAVGDLAQTTAGTWITRPPTRCPNGHQLGPNKALVVYQEACQRDDLVDPITLFIATGLRIPELLGLQWSDFDERAATLTITGKVVRAAGKGLMRIDETKTAAGRRTLPLPSFAVTVLTARRSLPYLGQQSMVFPSTAGTWRDPDNIRARWIEVRGDLGVPG
jgi:integrase